MATVHVITDSTADIPRELVEELNISVIPLKVHLQGKTYLDGINLSPETFYKKLKELDEMPTTSQPSPYDFLDAYQRAIDAGATEILSIHLSSALSGTYQSAILAQQMLEHDSVQVTVMDAKVTSYPMGGAVVAAARSAQKGLSLEECKKSAEGYLKNQQVYFIVDTLDYLQKGGRIGKASAVLGSLLNIKPILSFSEDGEVYAVDKVRGKKKAIQRVLDKVKEKIPNGSISLTILHTDHEEEAGKWAEQIEAMSIFTIKEKIVTNIGPVVGAHAGPKTLACLMVPWKGDS